MKKLLTLTSILLVLILIIYLVQDDDKKASERCLSKAHSYEKILCLQQYFKEFTKSNSAELAMAKAEEFKAEGVIDDCHLIAHYIGEANLEKSNFDFGRALSTCSLGCIEGCFHGVMEAYVSQKTDSLEFRSGITTMCDSVSSDPLLQRQCIHGIGHGLIARGYLPILDAVGMCQIFEDTYSQDTCLGGLFMENMDGYLLFNETYLRDKIPTICEDTVELKDQELTSSCIDAIGEGLMFYTGHNLAKSEELCEELPMDHVSICKKAAAFEEEVNLRN